MADGATIVGPHQSFATECMLLDAKVRRLQRENDELRHDIGRYVAIASGQAEEVERLRAALGPFVRLLELAEDDPEQYDDYVLCRLHCSMDDLRDARAALAEEPRDAAD